MNWSSPNRFHWCQVIRSLIHQCRELLMKNLRLDSLVQQWLRANFHVLVNLMRDHKHTNCNPWNLQKELWHNLPALWNTHYIMNCKQSGNKQNHCTRFVRYSILSLQNHKHQNNRLSIQHRVTRNLSQCRRSNLDHF